MKQPAKLNTISKQYANGIPLLEYTLLNNYLHGIRREWYPSGQLKLEETFQLGKQDGLSRRWAENGILIFEGYYATGTLEGIATHWYETGFLKRRLTLHIGKRNGIYEEWYPSGNKQYEHTYRNDKLNGYCKDYYDIPGTVKVIYNMEDNIRIGKYKEFDTTGNLITDTIYEPCTDTLERYDNLYAGNYNGLYEQGADPFHTNPYKSRPINNTTTSSEEH
jgi:antitoxin component YwqK of YwqJK toxin-antitoxin module